MRDQFIVEDARLIEFDIDTCIAQIAKLLDLSPTNPVLWAGSEFFGSAYNSSCQGIDLGLTGDGERSDSDPSISEVSVSEGEAVLE